MRYRVSDRGIACAKVLGQEQLRGVYEDWTIEFWGLGVSAKRGGWQGQLEWNL